MLCISDTSTCTKTVYMGLYLAYLVLAYKERLISTVCFFFSYFCWCCLRYFWHVRNLRHYSHLRAFSIIISGKFNSRYPSFFFSFFHVVSKLCKSDLSGYLVLSYIETLVSTVSHLLATLCLSIICMSWALKLSNMFWVCYQAWALSIFETIHYCQIWKDQFQILIKYLW